MDLSQRTRKVDIEKMSNEAIDQLSEQLGQKVAQICDEAAAKVNQLLSIYGGKPVKIGIVFDGLPEKEQKKLKLPKKRGRKPKKES